MSLLRLRQENDSPDGFLCPLCNGRCDKDEWTTEYGDPVEGSHRVTCPHCHKNFTLFVEVNVVYRPLK